MFHEMSEIKAGWNWRKGNKADAEEAWGFVKDFNSQFLPSIEPLPFLAFKNFEEVDLARLWRLHQESMREYFMAVPLHGYKNLSKPRAVCRAFAAEFGALLDILAQRFQEYMGIVGKKLKAEIQKKSGLDRDLTDVESYKSLCFW